LGQFLKNYRTFYPKNCHQALKNMGLGSGIRKQPIPDPESRGQKGTGSRIRIRNTDRRPRISQKYLIVFRDGAISLKTHTEITAILQWFYLNKVVSKYAKSILAYMENKLKEYKRIRRIVRTPRVFCRK
jgi:hypothetical protein